MLVALASLQFGTVVVLGKLALRTDLPLMSLLAFRYALSALLLAAILLVLRQPLAAARKERLGAVILGVATYAVESSFFFAALRHGTAATVTLLFFTYPVFVMLGSMGLGHGTPTRKVVGSLAFGVGGAAIVVGSAGGLSIAGLGVAFALCSAVMYSAYLMGADAVLRRTTPLTASMWVNASVAVALGGVALATGGMRPPSGWAEWGPILAMSAASSGAFVCLLAGLRRLGAVRTAIIAATEPLASALLAFAILGEEVRLGTAIGGALILGGAVMATMARTRPLPVEPSSP